MKGSIAHVLCPSMNFSPHGFCASLCFCKASDQHYQWPRGSRWSVDAVWITDLSAESTVLPTSTLTHLLDFRSRGISGMDEIGDLCFVILYSHDFGVDCYSVGFSCAENFFFLSCLIQPLPSHFCAGETSHFTGHLMILFFALGGRPRKEELG